MNFRFHFIWPTREQWIRLAIGIGCAVAVDAAMTFDGYPRIDAKLGGLAAMVFAGLAMRWALPDGGTKV